MVLLVLFVPARASLGLAKVLFWYSIQALDPGFVVFSSGVSHSPFLIVVIGRLLAPIQGQCLRWSHSDRSDHGDNHAHGLRVAPA